MGNILFIVWRESVEAMLVIGIIYTWLCNQPQFSNGFRYLWGGVGLGIGLAVTLAVVMLSLQNQLSGEDFEYFQIGMVLLAAALITQMVFWMRKHGRTLKRELESDVKKVAETANWWGMCLVVTLAVAREGAEMVVFLYGTALQTHGIAWLSFMGMTGIGLAAALFTFWLLNQGSRYFSWRVFFKLTEVLLLLLAASMLINGLEKLMGIGLFPAWIDPIWNSTWLLDDTSTLGSLVASFTGYRSQPALSLLSAYLLYWGMIIVLMRWLKPV